MSKLTSYSELLNHVDLKTLENHRYSHALTFFHKCMYSMGPISIKEMFIFRNYEHDLRRFNKLHQPTYNSRFIHKSYHYITLRIWNNLPDCVRRAPSLYVF